MAIATIEQIRDDIKKVLPIADTDVYDEELLMLTAGAINKIEKEGVPNSFDYGTPAYYDYLCCLRYQVASDMDLDIDIERLRIQYLARVNTLRCTLNR